MNDDVTAAPHGASPIASGDKGEEVLAWLIGGENEGRGAFVTMSREVKNVAKARDLRVVPLYAHPQLYRCDGCGRETFHPEADLISIKASGNAALTEIRRKP